MKLHTQILGQGKDMVIIHGFLGMGDNWRTLSKSFAEEGYRVHTPDMRNHGKSPHDDNFSYEVMAEDVLAYFKEHNVEKAVLIGHSMGGKIAMHFASKYPEYIQKLIVVDISPKAYKPHHDDILDCLLALKEQKLESRKDAEAVLKQKIDNQGVRLFLLKNLSRDKDNTLSLKPNIDAFIANKTNIGEALNENASVNSETLFIKGENSNYIVKEDEYLIAEQFSKAKIATIEKAGHWVHAERPKLFFKTVMDFITD
jgi:pimeloyl-ACP methyl ester carboxylesterase